MIMCDSDRARSFHVRGQLACHIFCSWFRQSWSGVAGSCERKSCLTHSIGLQALYSGVGVWEIDEAVKHPVQRVEDFVVALAVADTAADHATARQAMVWSHGTRRGEEVVLQLVSRRHECCVHVCRRRRGLGCAVGVCRVLHGCYGIGVSLLLTSHTPRGKRGELTFEVSATLSLELLAPSPDRVEDEAHAHSASYFELEAVVDDGSGVLAVAVVGHLLLSAPLLDASSVPHLDHQLRKSPWEVVVDDAHASDCLNGTVEEYSASLEFNLSREERAK